MAKFEVNVQYLYNHKVVVEAESLLEATRKAREMENSEVVGKDTILVEDLEEPQCTFVKLI